MPWAVLVVDAPLPFLAPPPRMYFSSYESTPLAVTGISTTDAYDGSPSNTDTFISMMSETHGSTSACRS